MTKNIFYCFLFTFLHFAFQNQDSSTKNLSKAAQLLEETKNLKASSNYNLALKNTLEAKDIYIDLQKWEDAVQCYTEASYLSGWLRTPDLEKKAFYLNKAKKLATEHLPNDHLEIAKIHQYKGELYLDYQQLDSFFFHFEQAELLYKKRQKWTHAAWMMYTIAVTYYNNDRYNKAQNYLKKIDLFAQEHKLIEDIFVAIYELDALIHYTVLEDYEKAIELTNKALNTLISKESKNLQDSTFLLTDYFNLGQYHKTKRDFIRASYYFKQALALTEQVWTDPTEKTNILIEYGKTLMFLEKNKLANTVFKKALQANKQESIKTLKDKNKGNVYYEISRNYHRLNLFDSATYFINQAIQTVNSNPNIAHMNLKFQLQLANIYQFKGEAEKAINHLQPFLSNIHSFKPIRKLQLLSILEKSYIDKK